MIEGRSVLAVIPARGGSKGLPRKNVADLGGKPLIAWTIEAARQSRYIDRLVLSSEDAEIRRVAQAWGCDVPFERPPALASDDAPGIAPVLHALAELPGYDYVLLLQPTSPLRASADIDGALDLCVQAGAPACVSVTSVDKSPYWMFRLGDAQRLAPIMETANMPLRRQDTEPLYQLNGAIYVARTDWLLESRAFVTSETVGYRMPKERSIDIDTPIDMRLCQWLAAPTAREDG